MSDLPRDVCWFPLKSDDFMIIGPKVCFQNFEITRWSRETTTPHAIVCLGNEQMFGGGPVFEAIHNDAGPNLSNALLAIPEVQPGIRCPFGQAKITPGYQLPAKCVIHTVDPIYGPDVCPEELLRTVYRSCLFLAKERNIKFIAFPDISVSSYPVEEAATVAFSTVREFADDFNQVHFVISSPDIYRVWVDKAEQMFQTSSEDEDQLLKASDY